MNKKIFEQVAEEFTNYVTDNYDNGFEDAPEDLNTPEGFLGLFQNYLEGIIEQDPHNDNIKMYQHVLNHFDEVGVEECLSPVVRVQEVVFLVIHQDKFLVADF